MDTWKACAVGLRTQAMAYGAVEKVWEVDGQEFAERGNWFMYIRCVSTSKHMPVTRGGHATPMCTPWGVHTQAA